MVSLSSGYRLSNIMILLPIFFSSLKTIDLKVILINFRVRESCLMVRKFIRLKSMKDILHHLL
jgi:hypothetical protein